MVRSDGGGGDPKSRCSSDYIQSWLEKTQRRPAWEPPNETRRDEDVPWRPHDLGVVDTEMPTYLSNLRKRRRGSLDSSIIPDRPRQAEYRALGTAIAKRPSSARGRWDRDEPERPQSSATMSPVSRKHDAGPFEKRARHKTKPDKYETRKRKNTEEGDGRQKARRTRAPGKKKLISSREVMDNFTSNAILAEGRLTVKPALAPGLYGNARCGSRKELPDLAYNRMDFLAKARRRDGDYEHSSTEPRGSLRRKKGGMPDSSPLFVPPSESSEPMRDECSGDKEAMYPQVWEHSGKGIPVAHRPRTAPMEAGTIYEPPRRRGYRGPARAGSSLDSRDFSARDRSPPYGAESPGKEAEDNIGSTLEPMRRLLWGTGVFDGLERASHSATDVHQHLERAGRRASPYQETATRTRERVRCADKSTMATLPEAGYDSVLRPSCGPQTTAKADGIRKTDAAISEYQPQARVEPSHRRVSNLATVHAAVIAPTGDIPVDRTRIALMAHIPVYCHQESQTESLWQVPQNPTYTHAETQTMPSPPQNCGRCQVTDDARYSPAQQHSSTEVVSLSGEPLTYGDSPIRAPYDADSRIVPNHLPDGRDEILSRFPSGRHQAHAALQQQISLELQGQPYTGRDGFEGPIPFPSAHQAPCHPDDRDALSFVTPMGNDMAFDEGSSYYPREHDGHHAESQGVGVKTSNEDPLPVSRHVDRETRAYHHPYPLHYRFDKVAAVQPFDTGEVVLYPHRSAFRMLAQEPCSYQQEAPYPPESLLRPSRPGVHGPGQNDVPSSGRNMAEYFQDENQINTGGQSHAFAYQQQKTREDLEHEQLEAYWRNRQLEFARRYGY